MHYEIQEFCLFGGWTNTWSDGDDNPSLYATEEEAESDLEYFFKQCQDSVDSGEMEDVPDREDFRIVEVKDE
jgi:hypothetical protein